MSFYVSDCQRFFTSQLVKDKTESKMKDIQREFSNFFEGPLSKPQLEHTIRNFKETGLRVRIEGSGRPVVGNVFKKEVEKLLQSAIGEKDLESIKIG